MGLVRTAAILALAPLLALAAARTAPAQTLESSLWQKRPLLLFSKSRSDAQLGAQTATLRGRRDELEARGMVAISIPGSGTPLALIGYVSLPPGANRALRQRFNPDENVFTAILVGPDGAELGRWHKPVNPDELFKLLDAPPPGQSAPRQGS